MIEEEFPGEREYEKPVMNYTVWVSDEVELDDETAKLADKYRNEAIDG